MAANLSSCQYQCSTSDSLEAGHEIILGLIDRGQGSFIDEEKEERKVSVAKFTGRGKRRRGSGREERVLEDTEVEETEDYDQLEKNVQAKPLAQS